MREQVNELDPRGAARAVATEVEGRYEGSAEGGVARADGVRFSSHA
jgi:hypothetical protein